MCSERAIKPIYLVFERKVPPAARGGPVNRVFEICKSLACVVHSSLCPGPPVSASGAMAIATRRPLAARGNAAMRRLRPRSVRCAVVASAARGAVRTPLNLYAALGVAPRAPAGAVDFAVQEKTAAPPAAACELREAALAARAQLRALAGSTLSSLSARSLRYGAGRRRRGQCAAPGAGAKLPPHAHAARAQSTCRCRRCRARCCCCRSRATATPRCGWARRRWRCGGL